MSWQRIVGVVLLGLAVACCGGLTLLATVGHGLMRATP